MPSQSFSYTYCSSSTSINGGPPQRTTYAERSYTDRSGTTTERFHQLPGQRPVYESEATGARRRMNASAGISAQNRITDVTDGDEARKRDEYYAKRKGGA